MKVAIRVDASGRIGTGHVVRCLTLAHALRKRGAAVRFVCRQHPGHLIAMVREQGFDAAVLPPPPRPADPASEDYAQWLGVPISQDAAQTAQALGGSPVEWLVVDHYALDETWQRAMRAHAGRVLAIEDLPGRRHDCDLLLDQNLSASSSSNALSRAAGARLLLGPRYALLRHEYAERRAGLNRREGRVDRVLVFFGGTDPDNLTRTALEALSEPSLTHLCVDVVAGPNYAWRAQLEAQAARRGNAMVYPAQPHLADLMANANLAIGGGGTTTWERMCMGLPSVLVSLAGNQRPSSLALAQRDLAVYAGHFDEVDSAGLAKLIESLAHDRARLARLSQQGMLCVDGRGAARVAESMMPSTAEVLKLRRAAAADVADYFFWANEPESRASAFQTDPIAWDTHAAWFAARLDDPCSRLLVLEAAGLPVGQVRFDRRGDTIYLDYMLDPLVRGRGWAARLVKAGLVELQADGPAKVRAEVKPENHASLAVFRRLGFTESKLAPTERSVFELMLR